MKRSYQNAAYNHNVYPAALGKVFSEARKARFCQLLSAYYCNDILIPRQVVVEVLRTSTSTKLGKTIVQVGP